MAISPVTGVVAGLAVCVLGDFSAGGRFVSGDDAFVGEGVFGPDANLTVFMAALGLRFSFLTVCFFGVASFVRWPSLG